jgi:hypothetical protein
VVAGTVWSTEFSKEIPSITMIVTLTPDKLTIVLLPPLLPRSLRGPFVSFGIVTMDKVGLLPEGLELSEMVALSLSLASS